MRGMAHGLVSSRQGTPEEPYLRGHGCNFRVTSCVTKVPDLGT